MYFFFLGLFVKDERVLLREDVPGDHNNFDCYYGTMVTVNYQQVDLFLPSPFYSSERRLQFFSSSHPSYSKNTMYLN